MTERRSDFKTILVLDDDPHFHKLVVPVLTSRGHRVLSAHTGSEASGLIAKGAVDLAIVDGQLPDVNGLDWIAQTRRAGHDMLVMFVAAYWRDAQSYHRLTRELAVSLVLHKPVMASVFAAEVDFLLGKPLAAFSQAARDDFEDTLLALRAEYARELPSRLQELTSLVAQMMTQPANVFLAGEARAQAHKLRGTAASYGFNDISEAAARLEEAIIAVQAGADGSDRQLQAMQAALAAAAEAANRAAFEAESKLPRTQKPEQLPLEVQEESAIARILVVDDDAAFLDLVDELARAQQLEVVRASNAGEALDAACLVEVGAALIDVELGSRDAAFKLALDLRALPDYADLPLGFLTGAGHIERTPQLDNFGSNFLVFDRSLRGDAFTAAVRQLTAIRQASRPSVLVIDDDSDFLKRTAFVLTHEGMQVRTLENTADILDEMHSFAPDAVLLDVMMPGVSGFDICRMLRTIARWRDLPIIFLTAYADIDTRIACLKCGGDDYLTKPVVNEELLVRLRMHLERARLLKERLERDNVSGVLNRRPFMEQLSAMLVEAKRQNWCVTVALLELEGLDQCTRHVVSDAVLGVAGNLLSRRLRVEYLKGRWGQNKLFVAFRNEPVQAAEIVLQSISDEFGAMQILQHEDCNERPKISFGVACYPDDGASLHELVQAADRRLKQRGYPQPAAAGKQPG